MRKSQLTSALGLLLVLHFPLVEAATLETAVADYRILPREYRLDGVVEAVHRTTVSAQTQGQVQEILYDLDDYVEKGAVLVRLKDTEHRARVAQAAADLKAAAARLQQAREAYDRIQGLHRKKNVSAAAMDQATADLSRAEAGLEAANARLEEAQEQLGYTQIRAPYSGIVTQRHIETGEMVSPGSPVMTGMSLEALRVVVDVPQSVVPSLRHADRSGPIARIDLPNGETLATRDITIFPYADLGSNTFRVRIDLPAPTRERPRGVFPGMFVKTAFLVGEDRALAVPKSAVVHRSEVTGIYVLTADDQIHFRQIRLGRRLEDAQVVLAGLTAGERVAIDPVAAGIRLKSQTRVPQRATGEKAKG